LIPIAVVALAVSCSNDATAGSDSTTRTSVVSAVQESVTEPEQRFLDRIGQSSGTATHEMLEQGDDLCRTFAANEGRSRYDPTLDWATANGVDPGFARWVADAAIRTLCP
jgi:Protein of unknown function (DUF732)